MKRSRFERLRVKWFVELEKLAKANPELFPIGIITGVVLNVVPVASMASQDLVTVSPGIAAGLPRHINLAVQEIFARIFSN